VVGLVDVKGLGVDRPIARLGVAWPGVLESSHMSEDGIATSGNLVINVFTDTGERPVRKETSELRTKSCHLIPRILR